jgi:hypothetical protein
MGPRLPEAALTTCKAHGALGEQALSAVAFTHHTVELERDPARRRVRTRPLLALVLHSLLGSVDLPAFPLLHGFAHPHTSKPKRSSSSPSPGRADPSATLARANPPSTNGQREGPPNAPPPREAQTSDPGEEEESWPRTSTGSCPSYSPSNSRASSAGGRHSAHSSAYVSVSAMRLL